MLVYQRVPPTNPGAIPGLTSGSHHLNASLNFETVMTPGRASTQENPLTQTSDRSPLFNIMKAIKTMVNQDHSSSLIIMVLIINVGLIPYDGSSGKPSLIIVNQALIIIHHHG